MDLIFVGSEATAYYSGQEACEGVFLPSHIYEKYHEEIEDIFTSYYFYELDGKHSEVRGDLVTMGFNSPEGITEFIHKNNVEYEEYYLLEQLDDDRFTAEEIENIAEQVSAAHKRVSEILAQLKTHTFTLTNEEYEAVTELLDEMRGD